MVMPSILIVEDEQIVAMDIQNALEKNGFAVVGRADRGEEAVRKAGELRPSLVLMDINLKGRMDGIEAAVQIRESLGLPVIFLTAYGTSAIVDRARLAEPFAYIFKPFDERELVSNITMALHKHEMDRRVRESEEKLRSVIQNSSDGIVLADAHGNLIEWNNAAEQISGLKRMEVIGRPIWDIIFSILPSEQRIPEVYEAVSSEWKLVIEKGYHGDLDQMKEVEIEDLQGRRRVIQSNGFSINGPQGALAGTIIRDITEQKRVEAALKENETIFSSFLEQSQVYVFFKDRDIRSLRLSRNYEEMLGMPLADLLGKNMDDLFPSELAKRMVEDDLQILNEGRRVTVVEQFNGRTYETVKFPIFKDGRPEMLAGLTVDITERKQAEEALLIKEAAIASSINAIALSDLGGCLTYVNKAFLKMWGFDLETDVLGKMVTGFWMHQEQSTQVIDALQKEGSWVGEMTAKKRDGSRLETQVSAHLVKGTDGRPLCMMASFLDITERKRADADLRKLSQAVEQSANAIVITDIEGNIEYANPKFVEISGYSLSEVLGKNPRIVKSGEHNPEFYRNLWKTIKEGRVWRGEVHNRRKDGTLYWEDSTITPVYDSAHKLINFIAIKEDITARKMLEEAERDHRRLAEALRDTSAALNSTLKLDEVLDRVLENIEKVTTFDAAMVLLIEGHSVRKIRQLNNFQGVTHQNVMGNTSANLINLPILKQLRDTQRPCLIPDTLADPRWQAIAGMGWIRSFISAPVVIRGHVVGIINILSATPDFFTASHAERLMVFAGQAAVAVENAQLFEHAYYLSVTDPLTELVNRRHFFDAARFEFERTHRYNRTMSVLMVDIDHFKNINDAHGHAVGDLALREVAARIKRSVRTVDIVARYGGEEFIVLMPETGWYEASQVAERVRKSVSDSPIEDDIVTVMATLSIGVAEMDEKSRNIDQLIKYADQALYAAKEAGRNQVACYQNQ